MQRAELLKALRDALDAVPPYTPPATAAQVGIYANEPIFASGGTSTLRIGPQVDVQALLTHAADEIERLSAAPPSAWMEIDENTPRDGTPILARVERADGLWKYLNGRTFVITHQGFTASDFNLGWSVYPGLGGAPDEWFGGWAHLPPSEIREEGA